MVTLKRMGIMKRTILFIFCLALLVAGCSKEQVIETMTGETPRHLTIDITVNPEGPDTRAVKTGWENEDVIFVFFNNVPAPKYLKMSYDGTKWTTVEMNGDSAGSLGLAENATGTMRAVFLPFGKDATVSAAGDAFAFSATYYSYYLTATLD